MSKEQEQRQAEREKRHELGVRRRHPVSFPMHLWRSFLLQYPLQSKAENFAGNLSAEHEENLDFAGRPDQGRVRNAEALGNEGEPGAEVGYGVVWILRASASV